MPAPTSTAPGDAPAPDIDALLNRANLALARSRQLVASWLPPTGNADVGNDEDDDIDDEEDAKLFETTPELLGVGAKPPPEGGVTGGDANGLGAWWSGPRQAGLRKQMLGRGNAARSGNARARPRPAAAADAGRSKDDESNDNEAGRTALMKGTKRKWTRESEPVNEAEVGNTVARQGRRASAHGDKGDGMEEGTAAGRKTKPGTYLDEVLEAKRRRKVNKKRKKEKKGDDVMEDAADQAQ